MRFLLTVLFSLSITNANAVDYEYTKKEQARIRACFKKCAKKKPEKKRLNCILKKCRKLGKEV